MFETCNGESVHVVDEIDENKDCNSNAVPEKFLPGVQKPLLDTKSM